MTFARRSVLVSLVTLGLILLMLSSYCHHQKLKSKSNKPLNANVLASYSHQYVEPRLNNDSTILPSRDRRIYEMHLWRGISRPSTQHHGPKLTNATEDCYDNTVQLSSDRKAAIAEFCQKAQCAQWVVDEIAMAVDIWEAGVAERTTNKSSSLLLVNHSNITKSRNSDERQGEHTSKLNVNSTRPRAGVYNVTQCNFALPPISDKQLSDPLTWRRVARNGTNADIHLSRAYFDRRFDNDIIRIIGIAISRPSVNAPMKCVVWNSPQRQQKHSLEFGSTGIKTNSQCLISQADKFVVNAQTFIPDSDTYDQYIFSCDLANRPPGFTIAFVSLTTSDAVAPSVALRVHHQHVAAGKQDNLRVALCVPPLFGSPDAGRLVEWLEVHRKLGVSQVFFYGTFLNGNIVQLLKRYISSGYVHYTDARPCLKHEPEASVLLNESPVLNDCLYRNMFRYDFLLTSDIDEIIVPRHHGNYTALLRHLHQVKPRSMSGTASSVNTQTSLHSITTYQSFAVRNAYFFTIGDNLSDKRTMASQHRRHAISSLGYSSKSFINAQACIGLQNHACWHHVAVSGSAMLRGVSPDLALLHHYKTCHFDTYFNQAGLCDVIMQSYVCDGILAQHS